MPRLILLGLISVLIAAFALRVGDLLPSGADLVAPVDSVSVIVQEQP